MGSGELILTVDGLAGGGDGVGHHEGRALFVPDTAPGDLALVRLLPGGGRSFGRATLVEILRPGPGRREPACPLASRCGGCQWQHLRYPQQLSAKGELLARAFRQARVAAPEPELVPAPAPLGYRSRARLRWRRTSRGVGVGYLGRRSDRLVDVPLCPVLLPSISQVPGALSEVVVEDEPWETLLGSLPDPRELFSGLGRGGEVHLLGSEGGERGAWITGDKGSVGWGAGEVDQSAPGEAPFWTVPRLFSQANPAVNRRLREVVVAWARQGTPGGPLVELFAGSGNLTLGLAELGRVVAVESEPEAVELGRRNLTGRKVSWVLGDAREEVARLIDQNVAPDLLVLDPPRAGAKELVESMGRLGARRVLYVSCDPMTLARDVSSMAGVGYMLSRLCLLDTMPQTYHFETVAELKLGSVRLTAPASA